MSLYDLLNNQKVYLDGALGTMLYSSGLPANEPSEKANLLCPDIVSAIHRSYFEAGSNIVCANTFGASARKYADKQLEEIVANALAAAQKAKNESGGTQLKYVALDIGSLGALLKPLGNLDFEDSITMFSKLVRLGKKYGADLIFIETMNCIYETKAALLAAKENCSLPVFVSNTYSQNQKLLTGAPPEAAVAVLEGLRADAIGINCSYGPKELYGVLEKYLANASVPVIFKPNAGLPQTVNGKAVYSCSAASFAQEMRAAAKMGARLLGGCCGTTPEYISELIKATQNTDAKPITNKNITVVSSGSQAVFFDKKPILIGERINPTGKKRLRQALIENDAAYISDLAVKQQESGADILDINTGVPGTDEVKLLKDTVYTVQSVCDLPLQIDTSDSAAMEAALRHYNGKALINSVNAKKESMDSIFPLVKKYGGVCVCLTLDEKGIPETSDGRVSLAKKMIDEAAKYNISKSSLVFDALTMAVSAAPDAARVTLDSVKRIKNELGCHTVLGVSNISFGLPQRDIINSSFFTAALNAGLSGAILNTLSVEMMRSYRAYNALNGIDSGFAEYIAFAQSEQTVAVPEQAESPDEALKKAVIKGNCAAAAELTSELIKSTEPLKIVSDIIIPALDTVGSGFEKSTLFLPQLLMSAEAAKQAFDKIKAAVNSGTQKNEKKCTVIIATVKGDIHDIGKNIVKLLLENYGFNVYDLGKNVEPEDIVKEVTRLHSPLLGLSALMTTTLPAMEQTVELVHNAAPWCKIIVGGAVLNSDYAAKIGADKYARDAMETVRYANEINLQK